MSTNADEDHFGIRLARSLNSLPERALDSVSRLEINRRTVVRVVMVICAVCVGTAMAAWLMSAPRDKQQLLWRDYYAALDAKDYRKGAYAIDQLLAEQTHDPERIFWKAILEDRLGDKHAARDLMDKLVHSNYARAAVWFVRKDFAATALSTLSTDDKSRFTDLVRLGLQSTDRDDLQLVLRFAAAYLEEQGNIELAIGYLNRLSANDPGAHLAIAELWNRVGDVAKSKQASLLARDHFKRVLRQDTKDVNARLCLIRSLVLLDEEREAVVLATSGFQELKNAEFQTAGANAMTHWAMRLKSDAKSEAFLLTRVELMHRACQCAPADKKVCHQLLDFLMECASRKNTVAVLEEGLARGSDSESIHFVLGHLALFRQNWKEADAHLTLAEKLGSIVHDVTTTMLQEYMQQGSVQAKRSLGILAHQLERYPNEPSLKKAYQVLRQQTLPD